MPLATQLTNVPTRTWAQIWAVKSLSSSFSVLSPLFSSMTIHADDIKEATELLEEYDEEELEEPEVIPEIKKLAIPRMSAAQLAERAKRSGDAPEIVKDSITNVTLFDYSDIIADDIKTEK